MNPFHISIGYYPNAWRIDKGTYPCELVCHERVGKQLRCEGSEPSLRNIAAETFGDMCEVCRRTNAWHGDAPEVRPESDFSRERRKLFPWLTKGEPCTPEVEQLKPVWVLLLSSFNIVVIIGKGSSEGACDGPLYLGLVGPHVIVADTHTPKTRRRDQRWISRVMAKKEGLHLVHILRVAGMYKTSSITVNRLGNRIPTATSLSQPIHGLLPPVGFAIPFGEALFNCLGEHRIRASKVTSGDERVLRDGLQRFSDALPMARQLRVVQTVRIHRSWSRGCRTSGSASRSLRKRPHARSGSRIKRPPTLSGFLRVGGGDTPGNARERWHRDRDSTYATFTLSACGCRLTGWDSLGCLSRTCGRNRTALTRSCAFGTPTRG